MTDTVYLVEPLSDPPDCTVRVPGSKSITNRAVLLAALADGVSEIAGALASDDTQYMAAAWRQLGVPVDQHDPERWQVHGCNGVIPATDADVFVGNAGTAMRFLTAAVCLGHGRFRLDGTARMRQRPIQDLLDTLAQLGAHATAVTGCPPVTIDADGLPGGHARIAGDKSSQFLSALLMAAPYASRDVELEVAGTLIAQPYVQLTQAVMQQFGVTMEADPDYRRMRVPHGQRYRGCAYRVEADASSAHYFLAAAALSGGTVRVEGVGYNSIQGDVEFASVLREMGATVAQDATSTTVAGNGTLHGIDVDMNRISDTVPTLAVLAAFADGPVTIRNVAHIRLQESDRLHAVATELQRLGVRVRELDDGLRIEPSPIHPAVVDTYEDHRIAMSFALAGLRVGGIGIRDPQCVGKTFPDYFARLEGLRR